MKRLFLFAIIGLISSNTYGQEAAPTPVIKSFQSKFTKAEDVKWILEKPDEWEAEFKLGGKELSACFDSSGKWIETETKINKKELPAEVLKSLFLRFEGFEIEEVELIQTPDFQGYEMVLERQETEVEVLINNSGEITIKDVKVEDDEEDEKD